MNFMKKSAIVTFALAMLVSLTAQANTYVLDFDSVTTGAHVDQFYNGGTDSSGASGTNFGVAFNGFITVTGFGETSQPNLAYGSTGHDVIDIAAGFYGLSFTYGAFTPSNVSVYSGLDGTGTLLGSGTFTGNTSAFILGSVAFSGKAESIIVTSSPGTAGFDDITITAVPEPETYAMLLAGLGLVGFMTRRKSGKKAA